MLQKETLINWSPQRHILFLKVFLTGNIVSPSQANIWQELLKSSQALIFFLISPFSKFVTESWPPPSRKRRVLILWLCQTSKMENFAVTAVNCRCKALTLKYLWGRGYELPLKSLKLVGFCKDYWKICRIFRYFDVASIYWLLFW